MAQIATVNGFGLARRPFTALPYFFAEARAKYGPFIRFKIPVIGDVVFCGTPETVEEVLVTKARSFMKGRGLQRLRPAVGNGLLVSEAPEHLLNRRLVQPALHRKRLVDYAAIMSRRSYERVHGWGVDEQIDIEREMNRLALEIVAQALFGVDLGDRLDVISHGLDEAMSAFPALMVSGSEVVDGMPLFPHNRRLAAGLAKLNGVVEKIIADHDDGVDRGDVLSMLLAARDGEANVKMSPLQVRDEAMTILLAGHETTANALTWAFYLLQRHPDIERKLHAHVDAVLGDRELGFDDVPKLDYARAVFAETMRLYPPAWITTRDATEDVEIGGQLIRKGEQAVVSQYVMHRDPDYWPDPLRFDPDRFMTESSRPKYAYFPFGGGTRICIGESFSWTEGVIVLATIARYVRLLRTGPSDVRTLPLVTLRPRDPVFARVAPRVDAYRRAS